MDDGPLSYGEADERFAGADQARHGVTTSQSVFWNTEGRRHSNDYVYRGVPNRGARIVIRSRQWGDGYLIGTRGAVTNVDTDDFLEGEGRGESLAPASLYEDQLRRRLSRRGRDADG